MWDAAKSSKGLVAFNKRFYWTAPPNRALKRLGQPKRESALVDVVTQGGLEWVKVSTITETRLLFDLAKAGWECADSSSSDEDSEGEDNAVTESVLYPSSLSSPFAKARSSDSLVELVRLAIDLRRASVTNLVRYQHPAIRFVLPKISQTPSPQIQTILSQILATGASVQTGTGLSYFPCSGGPTNPPPLSSLSSIFPRLLPDPHESLTPTLNIDCTILLALVSDLSHYTRTPHSPSHHQAITRQISVEARDPLLPDSLYPALEGRDLVCTTEAATRMREIVEEIGTETERIRASLLFGPDAPGESNANLLTLFAARSDHAVPPSLRLPIKIIFPAISLQDLSPTARAVAACLTAINQSVFLYGWISGFTTVSSNRAVAKVIEGIVGEENERRAAARWSGEAGLIDGKAKAEREGALAVGKTDDGVANGEREVVRGPEIWLCSTARSLVGKDRNRKGVGPGTKVPR